MARVKVKLADNIARVVFIETDATDGATLGDNLFLPNGQVATPTTFAAWLGVSASGQAAQNHSQLAGLQYDDHKQYVLRSILTADGDLFTRTAGAVSRVGIGAANTWLRSIGGAPTWDAFEWGDIGGTLSNQTDLQSALDAKADKMLTLTAGVGLDGGGDLSANRTFDLDGATLASLTLADSSLQPDDIGVLVQGYDIILSLLAGLTDPNDNKFIMWDDSAGTFVFADAGGSGIGVDDEGYPVATATVLDFVGAGVTATDSGGGVVTVTIPGGGGGGYPEALGYAGMF